MTRCLGPWWRSADAVLLATALLAGSIAHAAPLRVQALMQQTESGPQRFPLVGAGDASDAAVAARINHRLFIDMFERIAPADATRGLREVEAQKWRALTGLSYRVVRNDERVLSLELRGEGCGAYCENFSVSHAFDTASGRHLELDDLFTPHGREAIARQVQAGNLDRIRKQVAALKKTRAKLSKATPGATADVDDSLALYEACLAERTGPAWRKIARTGEMSIEPAAVVFSQGRCSNHAMRALDDLGEFSTRLPVGQLRTWLTPYGLALLLDEGSTPAPTTPFGQVLRGTVGDRLPVTLWLRSAEEDGSVSGIYFYDRFRKPIDLSGRYRDGMLELNESESRAQWHLKPEGAVLRGSWDDGKKRLPATVGP